MINFNKAPCIYWCDSVKISYLQRRIIIHSLLYYELNVNCINDESFTDTVINNLNGKVFETRKEYKKSIIELFNDRHLLQSLSKQARISAETHSSRYFAEQILEVYKIAIMHKPKLKISTFEKIRKLIGGKENEKNNSTKSQNDTRI